jgi:thiol:disulfide interchange protein DsbC
MNKLLSILVATTILFGCNKSMNTSSSKTLNSDEVKAKITKAIPGLPSDAKVNKSVNGLYEVAVGRKVFYVSSDGKYVLFGNLIDVDSKENLTEKRVAELSKIDFSKLPLDLAIKEVNGNGSRKLVVFSDPDCPYCQMFEKQIAPNLTDTTIYTFMFPLPNHPNAKSDATKIWCSKDRAKTWQDWMRDKKPLPANTGCDSKDLDKIVEIANSVVQLEATPTLILANGQILQGMLPPEQLIAQMDKAVSK